MEFGQISASTNIIDVKNVEDMTFDKVLLSGTWIVNGEEQQFSFWTLSANNTPED